MNNKSIDLNCDSETGVLLEVVIGYPDNFHEDPDTVEIINQTQARIYSTTEIPTAQNAIPEFANFKQILEENGVTVHVPFACNVPDQMTPRDIGFVIGNTFFLASMAKKSRQLEWHGIAHLFPKFKQFVEVPKNIFIEGGDVVVDKGMVFIGYGQRTSLEGAAWLQKQLAGSPYKVVPVPIKDVADGEDCLHLDCAFVPVGNNHALYYGPAFKHPIPEIEENYKLIHVTQAEQFALATNVLSISPNIVISRDSAVRVNQVLSESGLTVITTKFDESPKTGGSFRCCSLPLIRK